MADALPDGIGMYLMMIFLAIAVIGMIMAIKNRIANNKATNLVKDGKLRDKLHDIERLQKRPQETKIDLAKKGDTWYKKPEESIDELMDKLEKDEDKK